MDDIFRKANNAELRSSHKKAMGEEHCISLQTDWLHENRRILLFENMPIEKKEKNVDSKMFSSSVIYLHRPRMSSILVW